ncbi:unnamed protein product [Leptosia nina]|uniref:Uncharacterized protein n=1 Tax=Leptosia nina TaxID=320188 RepID=A0AAV1JXH5_9NEOP
MPQTHPKIRPQIAGVAHCKTSQLLNQFQPTVIRMTNLQMTNVLLQIQCYAINNKNTAINLKIRPFQPTSGRPKSVVQKIPRKIHRSTEVTQE